MKYGLTALFVGLAFVSTAYAKPLAKDILVDLTGEKEEVIEALKDEKTYHEIAEQYGVSEEFYAKLREAKLARINEKYEEGKITEEQKERLLERINNGETKMQMRLGRNNKVNCMFN